MLAQTDTSGTARTIAKLWQADANGTPRQLQTLYQADANGVGRLIYSAASLSVDPDEADGYVATKGASPAYTNSLTVSGYTGSPAITWTVPTGWSVLSQGSATTAFKSPPVSVGVDINAAGSVTVSGQTVSFSLYASNNGVG